MSAAPAVELLWWEGCPSHPDALAELERRRAPEVHGSGVGLGGIESDAQAPGEQIRLVTQFEEGGLDLEIERHARIIVQ